VCALQLETIDMPLNETDKAWVRQEFQAAHKRHGFGKLTGFVKDWSGAGAAVAILLFVVLQWGTYVEFRTQTLDRLVQIEKNLTALNLKAQASLSSSEFQSALPDLKAALASAKKDNLKVGAQTIDALQKRLLDTSTNASDFWPAVSSFVSYRSQIQSTPLTANPPDCTDSLPTPNKVSAVTSPQTIEVSGGIYQNCRITLDSVQDQEKINEVLMHRNALITFKHCLVVYRGGNINLIVGWKNRHTKITLDDGTPPRYGIVNGNAISFEDCIFDFVVSVTPPYNGREVTQALLASPGNTVTLPPT
jgi:hypothetical protein